MKNSGTSLIVLLLIQLSCIESDHKLKPDDLVAKANNAYTILRDSSVKKLSGGRDTLLYEVNLERLPIRFQEEFKDENQKLVLALKNGRNRKISIQLLADSSAENIRISNILLKNKSIDGPFGEQMDYMIDQDYSIVIGKSNMASGSQKGKFVVILKQ
ncbi:hypothetical protein [Elizabethkingia anophelis]|uniref:hypothetical protein n=1 Tax=Elizabethkingia anophelis TaxID=1117645 RepID=UPI00320B37FA